MLIAIDHGNKQMKTACRPPFVSGLAESTTKPFGSDILMYQNKYYALSNQRIPYKRNKTEDDRFLILTLFGRTRSASSLRWVCHRHITGRRTRLLSSTFRTEVW